MKITLDEYVNAVQIINKYHEQIKNQLLYIKKTNQVIIFNSDYTLEQLFHEHKFKMSTRLRNSIHASIDKKYPIIVRDLSFNDIMKFRNIGKNTAIEFTELLDALEIEYKK